MVISQTVAERRMIEQHEWNAYVDWHPCGWWWHRAEWADYLVGHARGNVDRSFAMLDARGGICGLAVCVLTDKGKAAQGSPLPMPLANISAMQSTYKVLCGRLPGEVSFAECPLTALSPTPPCRDISIAPVMSSVLALQELPLEMLRANVRDSYRALIHKGLCLLHVRPITLISPYHALHRAAAGRETRESITWHYMQRWLWDDNLLCLLATHDSKPVGGACFLVYKQAAYYASAAYLPGAEKLGAAQAIMWTAIRMLKERGITQLEIGHSAEVSIQFFKDGWGGYPVPVRHFTLGRDQP